MQASLRKPLEHPLQCCRPFGHEQRRPETRLAAEAGRLGFPPHRLFWSVQHRARPCIDEKESTERNPSEVAFENGNVIGRQATLCSVGFPSRDADAVAVTQELQLSIVQGVAYVCVAIGQLQQGHWPVTVWEDSNIVCPPCAIPRREAAAPPCRPSRWFLRRQARRQSAVETVSQSRLHFVLIGEGLRALGPLPPD